MNTKLYLFKYTSRDFNFRYEKQENILVKSGDEK